MQPVQVFKLLNNSLQNKVRYRAMSFMWLAPQALLHCPLGVPQFAAERHSRRA